METLIGCQDQYVLTLALAQRDEKHMTELTAANNLMKQKLVHLTEARAATVREVDVITGHYDKAMKEVEELKGKLSESSFVVEMTPADLDNARAQGITPFMFKMRTLVLLQIIEAKAQCFDEPSSLSVIDAWKGRCIHTPTSIPPPRSPPPPFHCSGLNTSGRSSCTSSRPC